MAELPTNPSAEHLRKQAKRLAKGEGLKLAAAQHRLAKDYGFPDWTALMREVEGRRRPPLAAAAARGDVAAVRTLLAGGAAVDGEPGDSETPLWLACDGSAPAEARLAIATLLIEAGAHQQRGNAAGATALHAAARRGPAALVERLLRAGALFWQPDDEGRLPRQWAEAGTPMDKAQILDLLADGPRIQDEGFRAAVLALQAGDEATLARLLDARPELLTMRAIEPPLHPRGYFTDPKLFWFVANNPTLIPHSPDNIVAITQLMIDRGVEPADLNYALELVGTNAQMPAELQLAMVQKLHDAGARASAHAIDVILGHRQTRPVEWLIAHGLAWTAPIAAGLGRKAMLPALLTEATRAERDAALGLATINRQAEAVRLCLEVGADPNAFMPCHSHATPLHQAALDGRIDLLELLVAHGGRLYIRDKLWRGTPLGWAMHDGHKEAEAWIRARL